MFEHSPRIVGVRLPNAQQPQCRQTVLEGDLASAATTACCRRAIKWRVGASPPLVTRFTRLATQTKSPVATR